MESTNKPSISVEPSSVNAMFVVGGQRMSIRVSVKPETVVNNSATETNAKLETTNEDIYLLLKGPAHIIHHTDGRVGVAFLDEIGSRKQALFFKLDQGTSTNMLKVASLDLIIECNKAEFEALTPEDKRNIFPDSINQIVKDGSNMDSMNTTDPPIKST